MTFIRTPKAADILCGKDKTFGKHPGNMLYRDLIEAKALDYASAVYKLDKMKLTTEIVATMVTEFGSRFLRPVGIPNIADNASSTGTTTADGNASSTMIGWEEISLTAARDKTSHALRFCAANTGAASKVALLNKQPQPPSSEGDEIVVSEQPQSVPVPSPSPLPSAIPTIEVPTTATPSTSLIQSQLLSLQTTIKDENSVSQEELLQQQNNALQKGIEELIQQKLKQKEQEQLELKQRQLEAMLAQSNGDVGTGVRTKFKKLPTKASVTIHKTKIKIPESLLHSTTTPVKFNRVKVQKSSRKPKNATTVPEALPTYTSSSPQQVPPSPYNEQEQHQYVHPPPSPMIPVQHPMSASSTTRTVSTDMIVLATAAAAVEAAEARAVAAQQHQDKVEENEVKKVSKNQGLATRYTENENKVIPSVSNEELGVGMNHTGHSTMVITTD
jgi:hypothetical protein